MPLCNFCACADDSIAIWSDYADQLFCILKQLFSVSGYGHAVTLNLGTVSLLDRRS